MPCYCAKPLMPPYDYGPSYGPQHNEDINCIGMSVTQCKQELDTVLSQNPRFWKVRLICTDPATLGQIEAYCLNRYSYQMAWITQNTLYPHDPSHSPMLFNHYIQNM